MQSNKPKREKTKCLRLAVGCVVAWLWLCGLTLSVHALPATSDYLIQAWQTENGLPENIVNGIAQTSDGYLWCGTTHGLARFDGAKFKVYNGENTPELGSARIRQLFVDRHGTLWITVFEGLLVSLKDGRFTAYSLPKRETTARTIFWMAEDNDGALWLTIEDGTVFRFINGQFTLISRDWKYNEAMFRVYEDASGQVWVASVSLLARINNGKLDPVLIGQPGEYQFLCPSRNGGWWMENQGRVRLWRDGNFVADAGNWIRPDRLVEYCLEDRQGNVWVATLGKGIFCYSTNTAPRQFTVNEGLGSDLVRSLFEDSEGNLWAGTRTGGLNRLRPALFKTYGRKQGLSSVLVTAICEGRNGDLWVGNDGDGVDCLSSNGIKHFAEPQGLTSLAIRSVLVDDTGGLWVGSWVGGLFHYETNGFVHCLDIPGRDSAIGSLFEDSGHRIWLGQRTMNRLARLEDGVASTVSLNNFSPALDAIIITEDATDKSIWVGTDGNGLYHITGDQSRQFTRKDGLPSNTVRSLLSDRDGSLWIGTVDGGLCCLKNGRFVTCNMRNGLIDNVINYICDDGLGYFWFTSFQGIFRIDKKQLADFVAGSRSHVECLAFGQSDGMPALECPGGFQPAGCHTSDGHLWFPTIKGLVSVDPARVPAATKAPPVSIEEMLVDGETKYLLPDAPASLATAAPLQQTIPPGRHRLEFHYTGINLTAPERVRFRYRLDGLEKDWLEAGTARTVTYPHVPPGQYQFLVMACNQSGVWSDTPTGMPIFVQPYFWQTWWFYTIATFIIVSILGGVVYSVLRFRYQRKVKGLEVQLSVARERGRIAQDIHDGVGANLTEIAWLAELAEKGAANVDIVRAHSSKISATARETVRSFEEIVWAIFPQNDSLTGLVEYLGRRVDEMFESTNIRYRFSAQHTLPAIIIPAEVRHSFYLACKEALHNVIRHSGAKNVLVQVTTKDATLEVCIEDDGCGFDLDPSSSTGNGLRNMQRRLEALGGKFDLQSRPGGGTRIRMTIFLDAQAKP